MAMKKQIVLVLLMAGLLAGCGERTPMNVIMTNPTTGKSVYVTHSSWGWAMKGVAAALNAERQQKMAIEAAKMMGYTDMQEVGIKKKEAPVEAPVEAPTSVPTNEAKSAE